MYEGKYIRKCIKENVQKKMQKENVKKKMQKRKCKKENTQENV